MSPAIGFLDVLAIVGVHEQHAADALFLVLGRVEHRRAGFDLAGIDAAEGDRADERIVHDLEAEHREGLGVLRQTHDFLAGIDVDALDAAAIDRRRQIVDDRVEQRLHALVLEGRAAKDRDERDLPHRLADAALQRVDIRLFAVEIGAHDLVVELDGGFDQRVAIFLGLLEQLGGNFFVVIFGAEPLVLPDDGLHAQKIDDALEVALRADRQAACRSAGRRPWC